MSEHGEAAEEALPGVQRNPLTSIEENVAVAQVYALLAIEQRPEELLDQHQPRTATSRRNRSPRVRVGLGVRRPLEQHRDVSICQNRHPDSLPTLCAEVVERLHRSRRTSGGCGSNECRQREDEVFPGGHGPILPCLRFRSSGREGTLPTCGRGAACTAGNAARRPGYQWGSDGDRTHSPRVLLESLQVSGVDAQRAAGPPRIEHQ